MFTEHDNIRHKPTLVIVFKDLSKQQRRTVRIRMYMYGVYIRVYVFCMCMRLCVCACVRAHSRACVCVSRVSEKGGGLYMFMH